MEYNNTKMFKCSKIFPFDKLKSFKNNDNNYTNTEKDYAVAEKQDIISYAL